MNDLSRAVPYHESVQLGGGSGRDCYRNWAQVLDALLGKRANRAALLQWARSEWGLYFLCEEVPTEQNGRRGAYRLESPRGFRKLFSSEAPKVNALLLEFRLTVDGEPYSFEVKER